MATGERWTRGRKTRNSLSKHLHSFCKKNVCIPKDRMGGEKRKDVRRLLYSRIWLAVDWVLKLLPLDGWPNGVEQIMFIADECHRRLAFTAILTLVDHLCADACCRCHTSIHVSTPRPQPWLRPGSSRRHFFTRRRQSNTDIATGLSDVQFAESWRFTAEHQQRLVSACSFQQLIYQHRAKITGVSSCKMWSVFEKMPINVVFSLLKCSNIPNFMGATIEIVVDRFIELSALGQTNSLYSRSYTVNFAVCMPE